MILPEDERKWAWESHIYSFYCDGKFLGDSGVALTHGTESTTISVPGRIEDENRGVHETELRRSRLGADLYAAGTGRRG